MSICPAYPLGSLAVGLVFLTSAASGTELRNVKVGEAVPSFSLTAPDGTRIGNETYREKALLIVFVRPEHEKSLEALSVAQQVLGQNAEFPLAGLAVSTKPGTEAYFKQIADERGLTFPIAMDPERKMYGDLGVFVAPTTLLIDAKGVLRFVLPHMAVSHSRHLSVHTDLLLGKISQEEHDAKLVESNQSAMKGQDSWTRRLGFAQMLIDQQKFEEAVVILKELCQERNDVAAATLLGTCLLKLGRVDEAAESLELLGERQPGSPKVKVALARLALARGDKDLAEKYLVEAAQTSPEKGRILYLLGSLYERQGKIDKAVECYRKALQAAYGSSP